jgi:acetylornithine/succinyldiaminopimelate/putrescine aminotransferase
MAGKKTSAKNRVSAAQVRADEAKHLMNTYKRPAVLLTHGRGCRVYDSEGKDYLDFLASAFSSPIAAPKRSRAR